MSVFEDKGNLYPLWKIRAQEFFEAADAVWLSKIIAHKEECDPYGPEVIHELYRPAQLLMGLSLEVSLKALAVKENKVTINNDRLPKQLTTHSIEKLGELAEFNFIDNNELDLIRHLSEAVDWVAKYPIPTKNVHIQSPKYKAKSVLARNDQDFIIYKKIYDRIMSRLN